MDRKATIFEVKRFAVHDGDGIRTTVFFKGCPLKTLKHRKISNRKHKSTDKKILSAPLLYLN